jgi:hypothetical protein
MKIVSINNNNADHWPRCDYYNAKIILIIFLNVNGTYFLAIFSIIQVFKHIKQNTKKSPAENCFS